MESPHAFFYRRMEIIAGGIPTSKKYHEPRGEPAFFHVLVRGKLLCAATRGNCLETEKVLKSHQPPQALNRVVVSNMRPFMCDHCLFL
jgi:hypothetical protein